MLEISIHTKESLKKKKEEKEEKKKKKEQDEELLIFINQGLRSIVHHLTQRHKLLNENLLELLENTNPNYLFIY